MVQFTAVSYPVRIHSGQQALDALPAELARSAAVRTKRGRTQQLLDRVHGLLGERLAGVYARIGKDAPAEDVLETIAAARACQPIYCSL